MTNLQDLLSEYIEQQADETAREVVAEMLFNAPLSVLISRHTDEFKDLVNAILPNVRAHILDGQNDFPRWLAYIDKLGMRGTASEEELRKFFHERGARFAQVIESEIKSILEHTDGSYKEESERHYQLLLDGNFAEYHKHLNSRR